MEKSVTLASPVEGQALMGSLNSNFDLLGTLLAVSIELSETGITVTGDVENIEKASRVLERLIELHRAGQPLTMQLVTYLADAARSGNLEQVKAYSPDYICVTAKGRPIHSKTIGQGQYVEAIRKNDVAVCISPAGTGKTFLAVAMAVNAFRAHQVSRIILTRPAVEAGEKLGFLPGDLQSKVDP